MEMGYQLHATASLLPARIGYEAGLVLEPVWTLWKSIKYLDHSRNRSPAVKPVVHGYTDSTMLLKNTS
jgi:hypothetical protein